MEKYLISLLELSNRAIVPGLGAFIIRQQEPKELVFNDLLAFDDSMLTDRIMQEENLSKAGARARIRQFVEKVKKILEDDEAYHLENLGSLKMDASGKIEYTTKETKEIQEEEKTLEEPLTEPGVEEVPAVEPEEPAGDREEFILADEDVEVDVDATLEETPLEPDREEPPFSIDETGEAPGAPADESLEKPEPEPEPEPEEEPVQAEEPPENPANKMETSEPEEKPFSAYTQPYESSKKAWPWIVGSAALLVFLLAATWFMFPEMINSIFRKEASEALVQKEPAVSESGAEIPPVQEAEETAVLDETPGTREPGPAVKPAGKQYYIVAGCFAELKNAENYVRALSDEGYDASIFGMRKNLHAVCFNTHPTKQAAIAELHRIQNTFDPNAWVLYY